MKVESTAPDLDRQVGGGGEMYDRIQSFGRENRRWTEIDWMQERWKMLSQASGWLFSCDAGVDRSPQ